MNKIFCILLLPNENKNKNKNACWYNWVKELLDLGMVLPKIRYFLCVFSFLKPYSPNYPTQPIFLGFLDGFFGLTNPCTPHVKWLKRFII